MGVYKKHLDIACAGGTFIGTLNKNKKSFGIDISINQINYAKKNYENRNHKIFTIHNNKIPIKNNFFDLVTNLQLLEHLTLEDNKRILKETYRVLQKKGKLIITTPNYSSIWIIVEKLAKLAMMINI